MKKHFLDMEKSELVIQVKDSKQDRELIANLDFVSQDDETLDTQTIAPIKKHLGTLFRIRRTVVILVRKQIEWFEQHPNFESSMNREDLKPLIRLINKEGQLLFRHGLSGFEGARQLLIDIYDQVMPLKDKVEKKKIKGGAASDPNVWTWFDGRVRVVKKYGSVAKGKLWTYKEASIRFDNMKRFYIFLKEAGVSVPDHNSIYIIEQIEKTPSGIKSTGFYQVALSQEHLGRNVNLVYKSINNPRLVMRIYRKM